MSDRSVGYSGGKWDGVEVKCCFVGMGLEKARKLH